MKLPWSKPEEKSGAGWIALSNLPLANWARTDPATLVCTGNWAKRCAKRVWCHGGDEGSRRRFSFRI